MPPAAPLRRLHVNLPSHADLAAALVAAPMFVRCGSLPATAWRGAAKVCGPQKHALPEMLQDRLLNGKSSAESADAPAVC